MKKEKVWTTILILIVLSSFTFVIGQATDVTLYQYNAIPPDTANAYIKILEAEGSRTEANLIGRMSGTSTALTKSDVDTLTRASLVVSGSDLGTTVKDKIDTTPAKIVKYTPSTTTSNDKTTTTYTNKDTGKEEYRVTKTTDSSGKVTTNTETYSNGFLGFGAGWKPAEGQDAITSTLNSITPAPSLPGEGPQASATGLDLFLEGDYSSASTTCGRCGCSIG